MPINSSAPTGAYASSRPISAVSSATSNGASSGNEDLREAFVRPLFLARRVLEQERRQRGRKVYSLHAREVECIGKGKAHRPYEFGVKVSIVTTVKHSAGGQFVTHATALPGNPYEVVSRIFRTFGWLSGTRPWLTR